MEMEALPEFTLALRGYDREQVDAYAATMQRLLEEAERRAHDAESRLARGDADSRYTGRLAAILKLAEEEAADRRLAARRDAEALVEEGRGRAEAMLAGAREQAEARAEEILSRAEEDARRMVADAEARRHEQEAAAALIERRYSDIQGAMERLRAVLGEDGQPQRGAA
jgi:cell division septum initiation protein DivIVA